MAQMNTASRLSKEEVKKGPWSWEEDQILTNYIRIHGTGKWATLPKKAGLNRVGKSCRLRWLNYLRPGIVRGNIGKDEEDIIIKFQSLVGNRWSSIAEMLPGRTDNEIKNYWNTTLYKRLCYTKQPSASTKKNRSKTPKRKLHDRKLVNNLHWIQTMTTTCDTLKYPMVNMNEESYDHHQMVVNNAPPTRIGGNDLSSTINIGDPKIAHNPVEWLMADSEDHGHCSNYSMNTNSTIGSTLELEEEHNLFHLLMESDAGNFDNVFSQDQVHVINPNLVNWFSRVVEEDQAFNMIVANHGPCKNTPLLPQLDPILIDIDQVRLPNPNLVGQFSKVVEEYQAFSMNVANHDTYKNSPPLPHLDPLLIDQDQVHVINPNLVNRFSRVVEEDQAFNMNVANHDPCKNAPSLPQLDPLLIDRGGNDDNLFKFEVDQAAKDYEMKFDPNIENSLMAELEKLASFLGVDEWKM